ncbi:MAG: hypothetical protein A2Y14_03220 [Verrucomicrobia bacterium GWF2_51_19]|nr:MAG: hypothetical protein A2Y14_03220 [Verrucomicrobia bacterium GWF2_51_19]HCJ12377.1 hypothetical protein [Opitutae bacterium]
MANPTLNDKTIREFDRMHSEDSMTIRGAANKTLILLGLLVITGYWSWTQAMVNPGFTNVGWGLLILGTGVAFATAFKPTWSPITAPAYALIEGLILGTFSAYFERTYPGIVLQAVSITLSILLSMLILYQLGLLRATPTFKKMIFAATLGIGLLYLTSMVMGFFGTSIPFIHESSTAGIAFSLVVVVIASMNFILDFDMVERMADIGAPKWAEWYCGFALMVTLVWVYLEILRLLAKLRDRR